MRFSYLLVLSAAILVASHETVSAASISDNTKMSQGATPDSVLAVEPEETLKVSKPSDEDTEERVKLPVNWSVYDAKWKPKMAKKVEEGKLPTHIKKHYKSKDARGLDGLRKRKFALFNAEWLKKNKGGFDAAGGN